MSLVNKYLSLRLASAVILDSTQMAVISEQMCNTRRSHGFFTAYLAERLKSVSSIGSVHCCARAPALFGKVHKKTA